LLYFDARARSIHTAKNAAAKQDNYLSNNDESLLATNSGLAEKTTATEKANKDQLLLTFTETKQLQLAINKER
jgi:hypothetical protein